MSSIQKTLLSVLALFLLLPTAALAELRAELSPPVGSDYQQIEKLERARADASVLKSDLILSDFNVADIESMDASEASDEVDVLTGKFESGVIDERDAELALRLGDFETAAEIYAKIVAQTERIERRKAAMLSLADVYRSMDDPVRVTSILERFKEVFPDDSRVPDVLLRLGFLYREMGAAQQAVDAFFGVLKQSFKLQSGELAEYREITNEASYQIAETYYRMHQYQLASEFFTRLLRSARPNTPERLELLGKSAYANFFSGDYRKVLYLLELKGWDHVSVNQQVEFRFLRASAYWSLRDEESARAEIVNLATLPVEPNKDPYWNFWWKFVGNSLANDLFDQDDFAMAHKLYYSLLHLSNEKKWQLPIVFQIGRCREYLGETEEARSIYDKILSEIEAITETGRERNLVVLKTRVEDQINNLEWQSELGKARQNFAPHPTIPHDNPSLQSLTTAYAGGR